MEGEDQQGNPRARGRDDGDEDGNQRNVRPRRDNDQNVAAVPRQRPEPFLQLVQMELRNIVMKLGALRTGPTQLPANFRRVSLQELVADGPSPNTYMLCMMLSMNAATNTQTQQRSYSGSRGAQSNVRHTRRFGLMCLASDAGSNLFMIFTGNGICPRVMANVETRDNGDIRESWSVSPF